jgi:hypothetical protein
MKAVSDPDLTTTALPASMKARLDPASMTTAHPEWIKVPGRGRLAEPDKRVELHRWGALVGVCCLPYFLLFIKQCLVAVFE